VPLYLGFVRQGVQLNNNQQASYEGDLVTRLASARNYDRVFPSFEACLEEQKIVIIHTPSVHLYDSTNEEVRMLSLHSGTLGTVIPCWGQYSESEVHGHPYDAESYPGTHYPPVGDNLD